VKKNIEYIKKPFHYIKKLIITWRFQLKEYNYLKNLFSEIKRNQRINKIIVFNTIKLKRDYLDREFFIAKILALNGAKVYMLIDDGVMFHHDTQKKISLLDYKNPILYLYYKTIINRAIKAYKDPNLEILYYSKFLKKINYGNIKELKPFALSSTYRHFQNSILDFKDKDVKDFFQLSLKNAAVSRSVGEYVVEKIKPDYFVTSHGIYSTWGPTYEYVKKNKIKSYVYARIHSHSTNPQHIYFTTAKAQTLSRCQFWKEFKNTKVTKDMIRKVNEYFNNRINKKKSIDTRIYYQKTRNYRVNKNEGFKYYISLFPNISWDGNIPDRNKVFNGIYDWITSTINYLRDRDDIKVYIKPHPAETTLFKNTIKIQKLIEKHLEQKYNNIEIIPTEYNINTYEFLKSGIDLGICYDGILALELPYLKIPVILGCADGRFSVEGGNYCIKNKEDYFQYLDNLDYYIENFHRNYDKYYENIVRYTYWYIFVNSIRIPTILKTDRTKSNLFQVRKSDIKLTNRLKKLFS